MFVSVYALEELLFTPLVLNFRHKRYHLRLRGAMVCSLKPHLFWLEKSQVLCRGKLQFLCQAEVRADITSSPCFKMSSPVLAIFTVIYCEVSVGCVGGK